MIIESALVTAELANELVVIETYDDIYLGVPHVHEGQVAIGTGYRGRPVVLPLEEVIDVTKAMSHPDVVLVISSRKPTPAGPNSPSLRPPLAAYGQHSYL